MALQAFANGQGFLLSPLPVFPFTTSTGNMTIDAAGESAAIVGYINLSSGVGTSATVSAAGSGKMHVRMEAITFASGSTNVRIGVNDVGATGLEDGTHDVFADVTGGGGGLTGSTVNTVTMTSGTKTISHGDLVALVVEMTARGGTDSIVMPRSSTNGLVIPYATADTGSGPAKGAFGAPYIAIEFDNGVIGWMTNHMPRGVVAGSGFNSGSTPDEYALVFQVPFKASAVGIYALLSSLASTDDFEMILYSDPLGTPVAERTITQDMDLADTNGEQVWSRTFATAYTLSANTDYAIAIRPTTANSVAIFEIGLGTNGANLRKATPFGTNCSRYTRTNQSGAFGSQSTILIPAFGLWVGSLSDDVSSGGGNANILGGSVIK